jgi:hypothetical protein
VFAPNYDSATDSKKNLATAAGRLGWSWGTRVLALNESMPKTTMTTVCAAAIVRA